MIFDFLTSLPSVLVTLMYLCNINMGIAVLTLPIAFQQTGWMLSTFILTIIGFISFITVTFQIECLSIANAISYLKKTKPQLFVDDFEMEPETEDDNSSLGKPREEDENNSNELKGDENSNTTTKKEDENPSEVPEEDKSETELTSVKESQPSYGSVNSIETVEEGEDIFELRYSLELNDVAELFFEKFGRLFFSILSCVYHYGTVSLFCAVISISLCDMSCTFEHINRNIPLNDLDPCWHSFSITRGQCYRVFILIVFLAAGPFSFCKVENSLIFQVCSFIFRFAVFVTMITLTLISLSAGKAEGAPVMANLNGVPSFVGVAIYAFICQQTLPGIISSISNKKHLMWTPFVGYLFILSFYFLFAYTAVFTFPYLKDVYTLNFMNNRCNEGELSIIPRVIFLELLIPLFPVIAYSTNLQITSITLKNNLLSVITWCSDPCQSEATLIFNKNVVLPLLAIIPPVLIAMTTTSMLTLIAVVGCYTGIFAQCVIPSMLLLSARRKVDLYSEKNEELKHLFNTPNVYKSPFSHAAVLYFMFFWSFLCFVCVTFAFIV